MSRNKHLTKLYTKCPLHLKNVLALPWKIGSVRLSYQRSNCMHISLNSDKYDWQLLSLRNGQTCCKSHLLYTPYAIVNRFEVRRVRRPECGWDKIWRLLLQQRYCVFGM